MSKRIFADRQTHPPTTQQGRVPNCYYHKLPITNFCTKKKCTLPLCQECLPIHKKQHIKQKQIAMQGIIEFQIARMDCLNAFTQRKNQMQAIQQKFKSKIIAYRNSVIQVIDQVLDRFFQDCLITDGNIEILKEIHERTTEIRGGSLKELIRYYEDTYGAQHYRKLYKMYSGEYLNSFKFQLNKQKTQQLISTGIINTALKTSSAIQKKQQTEGISLSLSDYNQNSAAINIQAHKSDRLNLAKHISTSQQQQSEISSYKLLKSKKQNVVNNNTITSKPNIYTHTNRMQQPLSSVPSSNHSQVSKSKSLKKKGLSLSKSHQRLMIYSQQNLKIQQEKSTSPQRKSSWRNFIKMGQKKPQQHPTPPPQISQRRHDLNTGVLNPKQMRELLAKKKSQQKYKIIINRQPNKMHQFPQRI